MLLEHGVQFFAVDEEPASLLSSPEAAGPHPPPHRLGTSACFESCLTHVDEIATHDDILLHETSDVVVVGSARAVLDGLLAPCATLFANCTAEVRRSHPDEPARSVRPKPDDPSGASSIQPASPDGAARTLAGPFWREIGPATASE